MSLSRRSPRRILLVLLPIVLLFTTFVAITSPAEAATTERASIGAPFSGRWGYNVPTNASCGPSNSQTSHPSCHEIHGGADFSLDYYGANGRAVKLIVNDATGNLSYSWGASSTSCGTSTKVNIFVDGAQVGWIYVAHLVNAVRSGPISNGMTLGTVGNYSCAPANHVHIEIKADDGNRACYQDYGHAGAAVNEGSKLGGIGQTNATGIRQACSNEPPPTSDRDGDGIADGADRCPDQAGPGSTGGCPDRNLVRGGGFEDAAGWQAMSKTNFVTYTANQAAKGETPRSGARNAAFNTSASGGGIYQDIPTNIASGDTYCASSFVRSQTGGTASGSFTLWMLGGTPENGTRGYSKLGTKDSWRPVSTCVTATQSHSAVRIQFYPTPNGGTTQADDINVAKSLVKGGGFENASGWAPMPSTNFVTYTANQVAKGEAPRSGSRYAAFNSSASGGGIYQDFPASISAGDTYCGSSFVRAQTGGTASGTFTVWLLGTTEPENGARTYGALSTKDNWAPVSTCATATRAHSTVRVQFYSEKGTTQADDVNVARSLAKGGGFENASGWAAMAGTNFVTYASNQVSKGETPRSGARYAAINTNASGGGIYQDVPATITSGDTYCASAFVRSQTGGTASGTFTLWMLGSTPENGSRGYSKLSTKDRWSPVTTCVTATQSHSSLRIQFYPTPNRGTTQIDDVGFGNFSELTTQTLSSTRAPSITGTVKIGKTLKAKVGAWSPSAGSYTYQWRASGKNIKGATKSSYKIPRSLKGKKLSVVVTASRFGYSSRSATSPSTTKAK